MLENQIEISQDRSHDAELHSNEGARKLEQGNWQLDGHDANVCVSATVPLNNQNVMEGGQKQNGIAITISLCRDCYTNLPRTITHFRMMRGCQDDERTVVYFGQLYFGQILLWPIPLWPVQLWPGPGLFLAKSVFGLVRPTLARFSIYLNFSARPLHPTFLPRTTCFGPPCPSLTLPLPQTSSPPPPDPPLPAATNFIPARLEFSGFRVKDSQMTWKV